MNTYASLKNLFKLKNKKVLNAITMSLDGHSTKQYHMHIMTKISESARIKSRLRPTELDAVGRGKKKRNLELWNIIRKKLLTFLAKG